MNYHLRKPMDYYLAKKEVLQYVDQVPHPRDQKKLWIII